MDRFVVDIQITGSCNMNCQFCCGAPKELPGPSLEEFRLITSELKKVGVTTLVFTGGEPLAKPRLESFLKHAYQSGLEVYLSTNGVSLQRKYESVGRYLSVLGLPLDGSSRKINEEMTRNPDSAEWILSLLRLFKKSPPDHKVRVGTLITKINIHDIANIGRLLYKDKKIYPPDTWRLYEFSPLNRGYIHRKKFAIGSGEFRRTCRLLKKEFPFANISPLNHGGSDDSYFFVAPDLQLQVLMNDKFINLGNVLTMGTKKLLQRINQHQQIRIRGAKNREWLDQNYSLR